MDELSKLLAVPEYSYNGKRMKCLTAVPPRALESVISELLLRGYRGPRGREHELIVRPSYLKENCFIVIGLRDFVWEPDQ